MESITDGVQLHAHVTEQNKSNGTPMRTAKFTKSALAPTASMEAAPRRTSTGQFSDVSGSQTVAPNGTTYTTGQVNKRVPPGERQNKIPPSVSAVRKKCRFLD
jgi:hypothetical protein